MRRSAWLALPLLPLAAWLACEPSPVTLSSDRPALPAAPDGSTAPTSSALTTPTPPTDGMVLVPGASFDMGSKAKRAEPNESPVHRVTVSPFWIDRTEVTVGAYRACVAAGRCAAPLSGTSRRCTFAGDASLPINCVSFDEADHYCLAHAKRLPTEAEWELAARGAHERTYPWGNEEPTCDRAISRHGNQSAEGCSGDEGPRPVGERRKGQSPFGLLDLAGNVEEWVSDFYDDRHVTDASTDPRGAAPTTARVVRGGSWMSPWRDLRTTARSWASSHERGAGVGFRCARPERAAPPG